MSDVLRVEDLDTAIEQYESRGFRLDMIFPADDPREALMSVAPAVAGGLSQADTPDRQTCIRLIRADRDVEPPATAGGSEWIRGRAGMEYRDVIPDRLGGKVIASHIRLNEGGLVPDYVHYHKIAFQMIFCLRGRIRVVYEDQGEPFWLETGDLVLQPPEIRHRVLECTAGAEVIEITSPAEHETWVDHDLQLPTPITNAERPFSGRRFFFHKASADDARDGYEARLTCLAEDLTSAEGHHSLHDLVTTFSRSLSQT